MNNLRGIDVKIPLNIFTVITGVSGSGKSSLIKAFSTLPSAEDSTSWQMHQANMLAWRRPGRHQAHRVCGPEPYRQEHPQQPCHLSEGIRCHPHPLCQPASSQADGLHLSLLLIQCRGRKMRGVQGSGLCDHRDAIHGRPHPDLRGMQGQAIQARHTGGALWRKGHQRCAQHDRERGDRILQR